MLKWINSSRKNKIIAGISVDYAGSFIAIVVSFVVVPFYFHFISKEEYGVWLAVNGIISMIGLVEIGVDTYLTTKIADSNIFFSDEIKDILSNAVVVKGVIAFLFIMLGAIVYYCLPLLMPGKALAVEGAKNSFIIALVSIITGIFFSTITTVLNGRNHLALVNSFTFVFNTIASIMTVVLLYFGFGLISFPLSLLICSTINSLIQLVIVRKEYAHVFFRFNAISTRRIKDLIDYTKSFQMLRILYVIRTQYVILVITRLIGPAGVTQYNITNRIPQMIPSYVSKGALALFPSLSEFFAEGNLEKVKGIYIRMSRVILRLAFLSGILVYLLNEPFIALWVGRDKFAGSGISLLLTLYMGVSIIMSSIGTIVYAKGEFRKWPVLSVIEVAASIILSYLFYLYFGYFGIILGFFVSSSITSMYLYLLVNHILKIKMIEYLRSISNYVITPNLCSLLFGFFCVRAYPIEGWVALFVVPSLMISINFLAMEGMRFVFSKEKGLKARLLDAVRI